MPSFDTSTLNYTKGAITYPSYESTRARYSTSQGVRYTDNTGKADDPFNKASLDRQNLKIYDARPGQGRFDIDTHGFVIANLRTALPETLEVLLEDPEETEIRKTYWPEVEELAKHTVESAGRLPKYAFAFGTQKFVEFKAQRTNDLSAGVQGGYATVVHADFSEVAFDNAAYKMLTNRGVPEAEARDLDIMLVNVWKPFGQTVRDNPFAILDWASLDSSNDVHIHKRGTPMIKGNIYGSQVTYNPNHRWVYLPDQRSDEVWLFKQADSRAVDKFPGSLAQYAFHISFRLPDDPGKEHRTRRSIAVRLVLGFERGTPPKAAL